MRFDLENTRVKNAIVFPIAMTKAVFWFFTIFALVLSISIVFPDSRIFPLSFIRSERLGWMFIFLSFSSGAFSLWMFYKYYLMARKTERSLEYLQEAVRSKKSEDINIADYLSFDAAAAIYKASLFAKRKSISLTHNMIFLFLIESSRSDFIFKRLLISKEQFKKSLEIIVESQKKKRFESEEQKEKQILQNILFTAIDGAVLMKNRRITFGILFAAIVNADKTLENVFFDFGAKKEDLLNVSKWEGNYYKEYVTSRSFTRRLGKMSGIADDWTYGYTPVLSQYAKEVSISEKGGSRHVHLIGRRRELKRMEEILSSSGKNNIMLVGEPGVGIENLILGFVKRNKKGITSEYLRHKRFLKLNMSLLFSRSRNESDSVALFGKVFTEAQNAGNIILILEDLHNFIGEQSGKKIGSFDLASVLTPFLSSGSFQVVATTDYASYHSNIESNPAVSVLLEKIDVGEPSEEETLFILEDLVPMFERKHKVFISYYALASIVADSDVYIQNIPYPEKAISLLTEVISYVASHKTYGNIITQDHVTEVISQKTGIPLGRIEGEEKSKLLNMEQILHGSIIGQDYAVQVISEAMRRVRSGISERGKPIGTFLFLGPTGVGKTETAKALASVYFGSEDRMIRLDMSEYQDARSINRLIGNVDTKTEAQFANKVRENPFSLILLDEFEKSHPDIADLFLQILDEGRLTDAYQKKVSFKNTIIIATSNAGAEFIREYVISGQNIEVLKDKLKDYLLREKLFRPEFLNRFDAIAVFEPLKKDQIKEVARLFLRGLADRLFDEKGMKFKVTEELLDKIADLGYSLEFGAREMKRIIQDKVENRIAQDVIEGRYKYGSEIVIDPESIE